MHRKKHSTNRVQDYPRFQPSAGGLGTYPCGKRETTVVCWWEDGCVQFVGESGGLHTGGCC